MQSAPYDQSAQVRVDAALSREVEGHLRAAIEVALDQEVRAARFVELVRSTAPRDRVSVAPGDRPAREGG